MCLPSSLVCFNLKTQILYLGINFFNAKWFGHDQLTGKIDNLKIGILKEGFGLKNSEADVDKMVREAAEQLGTAGGAVVEEVSVPMHSDGKSEFCDCSWSFMR